MRFEYTQEYTHIDSDYVNSLIDKYSINDRPSVTVYIACYIDGIVTAEFNLEKCKAVEINNVPYMLFMTSQETNFEVFAIPFEDIRIFEFNDDGYVTLYVGEDYELPEPKDSEYYYD